MFYKEIGMKQGLSYLVFCPLRTLYNRKFILTATSLGANVVVVMRVHCTNIEKNISEYTQEMPQLQSTADKQKWQIKTSHIQPPKHQKQDLQQRNRIGTVSRNPTGGMGHS